MIFWAPDGAEEGELPAGAGSAPAARWEGGVLSPPPRSLSATGADTAGGAATLQGEAPPANRSNMPVKTADGFPTVAEPADGFPSPPCSPPIFMARRASDVDLDEEVELRRLEGGYPLANPAGAGRTSGAGGGEGDGTRTGGGGGRAPSPAIVPADGCPVQIPRADAPINEFTQNDVLLCGAFWHLFPLRRGLDDRPDKKQGTVSNRTSRHLMYHFSTRFSRDLQFTFYLADQSRRHNVTRAVSAKLKTGSEAHAEFVAMVNDPGFNDLLAHAVRDPKSPEAMKVYRRILPVIQGAGANVKWGSVERAAAITLIYGMMRRYGASSVFFTVAPDDVHHPTSITLSARSLKNSGFPADPDALLRYLREMPAQEGDLRSLADVLGDVCEGVDPATVLKVALLEAAKQRLAALNPVATVTVFHMLAEAVMTQLIGLPPGAYGPGRTGNCRRRLLTRDNSPAEFLAARSRGSL